MLRPTIALTLVLGLGSATSAAHAQPHSPKKYLLKPTSQRGVRYGKVAAMSGRVTRGGVRFILRGTKANQPLQATLISLQRRRKLRLDIHRTTWNTPKATLHTNRRGIATRRFRSSKHAGFIVRGPIGARFQLLVWVGPEVKQVAPTALTPMRRTP